MVLLLSATRFGFIAALAFGSGAALASAFCIWFICVAPVRGGTPFSLLLQRKGGKRKQLQPPVPARINHWHTASEPSVHMRSTSDQGRSRAAQETLCGVIGLLGRIRLCYGRATESWACGAMAQRPYAVALRSPAPEVEAAFFGYFLCGKQRK